MRASAMPDRVAEKAYDTISAEAAASRRSSCSVADGRQGDCCGCQSLSFCDDKNRRGRIAPSAGLRRCLQRRTALAKHCCGSG
jgi:hypothetical protein